MKATVIVEKDVDGIWLNEWLEVARFTHDLPDEFYSFSNEAYFCSCCGRIWARRRWEGCECPWWVNTRPHDGSPFDFYDFAAGLSATPNVQEYLVNEFLSDPTIAGYAAAAFK